MLNKHEITQSLIKQLEDAPPLSTALRHWWHDPRENSGLRLSTQGMAVFRKLDMEHHFFEIPPLKPGQLLTLNRYLSCPYYLQPAARNRAVWLLTLFGGKEATMYTLYGDIQKFLRGIAM